MERNFLRSSLRIPLLFNICINDIFVFVGEGFLSNYADDTALYCVQRKYVLNQSNLLDFIYLQKWLHDNYMILNPGKFYHMAFDLNATKNEFVYKDGTIVVSAEEHVVLGITINSSLTFFPHLKQLCKKVANKLNALTRITLYLSYIQR